MVDFEDIQTIPMIDIYKGLFIQRDFSFICERDGLFHGKQNEALRILTDDKIKIFAFGGAAGGAKSWTGCAWLAFMSLCYPGTRWFIGREELKRLRDSTLMTFYKVCKAYEVTSYKYNGQDHFIQFANGSRIDLLDLKYLPSDPLYERYGSIEYTGGWIEEAGEVHFGAFDTLKSRIGRQLNDVYNIFPKLFITLNPKKNWCDQIFWKPFRSGTLPDDYGFLQSLVTDNPYIDREYIKNLEAITDKIKKQRLLYGNFDYDDSDDALIIYDRLVDMFSNTFVNTGEPYITADIARFGSDKTVIGVWSGFRCEEIISYAHKSVLDTSNVINSLRNKYKVTLSNTIADEDGVGGGVIDIVGCEGFVNNSAPIQSGSSKENYQNLKSQCDYLMANKINKAEIFINCDSQEMRDMIVEEGQQVKRKDVDSDGKLSVIPKEIVKMNIGRSPDYWDMIKMRMWFELRPAREFFAL